MKRIALLLLNGMEMAIFFTWDTTAAKPNKHLGLAMECYLYSCIHARASSLVRKALM
jgi:hypothetical protein